MSDLLRPAARDWLLARRETLAAGALVLFGLWCASLGGWLLVPVGLALAGLGAGWAVAAERRRRFASATDAPGLIEVDEGRISYFAPALGGSVSLSDLVEIRILHLRGRSVWRLKQADGQALLIPTAAPGGAALFDALASLPGLDLDAMVAAAARPVPPPAALVTVSGETRVLWRRSGQGVVTRGGG